MRLYPSRSTLLMLCLLLAGGVGASQAQTPAKSEPPAPAWPQVITDGTSTLTVYQPQLDSWDGFTLQARSAVAVADKTGATTYGIVYASAHTLVDKATRWVLLDQYKITRVDFPDAQTQTPTWVRLLEKDAANRKKTISLDQLEAAMGTVEAQQASNSEPIENIPPTIITSETPAMLVYIDGHPAYRPMAGTALERVINTRPLLLKDAQGKHYLHVFDGWMVADSVSGDYARLAAAPADLAKAMKIAVDSRQVDLLTGQGGPDEMAPSLAKGPVPKIFIATAPTELIVTDGPPKWQPIQGTQLLYAQNTTGHLFKKIGDQSNYVLISGRWFRAADMAGPWTFAPATELPADFANIPDDSPKENVKASIAGTPQAKEAAIAASIPQTSAIDKTKVKMSPPQFDGEPQLKAIEPTSLQYVINTATPLIMVDAQHWYAVENGIWFVAPTVYGPWAVATIVPASLYSIPPSSPLHYVTYVKIYNSTGNIVVVGYTPGYQGTTVDPVSGVVVYGTGYPYTPWVGSVWYGPPVTYGLGVAVRYTPWTGWTFGFGFGWSSGGSTIAVGWGWGAYPWWGPYSWGYAWGPRIYPAPIAWAGAAYGYHGGKVAWGPGGWAGTTGNIYGQWGSRATVSKYSAGYNAWTGNKWATQVGTSYNSRTGVSAAGQRGAAHNVYTGDYAYGGSGVAVGKNGVAVAGQRGTVGNTRSGNQVSASQGVVYNPNTGKSANFASVGGKNASAARVNDNVYAGKDGKVYQKTDSGWEQKTGSNANRPPQTKPPAQGAKPLPAPRVAIPRSSATTGQAAATGSNSQYQNLDRQSAARTQGQQRTSNYRTSSQSMERSAGGAGFQRR